MNLAAGIHPHSLRDNHAPSRPGPPHPPRRSTHTSLTLQLQHRFLPPRLPLLNFPVPTRVSSSQPVLNPSCLPLQLTPQTMSFGDWCADLRAMRLRSAVIDELVFYMLKSGMARLWRDPTTLEVWISA